MVAMARALWKPHFQLSARASMAIRDQFVTQTLLRAMDKIVQATAVALKTAELPSASVPAGSQASCAT